ncbi:MAG TPA: tetratricopeptide repeat protein [Abditibacteriaceae bacterium]
MAKAPQKKNPPLSDRLSQASLPNAAPPNGALTHVRLDDCASTPQNHTANCGQSAACDLPEAIPEALVQERTAELQMALQEVSQLRDALGQRQRQIEAMHRVSETMFHHLNADTMARQTLDIALEVLGAEAGSLQLYDPDHDTLVYQYVVGPTAETLTGYVMPATQGISGQVLRTGVPDVTRHVRQHGGINPMLDQNGKSSHHADVMVTVPLKRRGGDALGVMQMLKTTEQSFERGDIEVLQVLCGQAASAIETARLAQEARKAEIAGIIGDVSHDIKNMLTPIQSGLQTIEPMLDQLFAEMEAFRERLPDREAARDLERMASLVRDNYGWVFSGALQSCELVEARAREIADAIKGEIAPPFFEEGDLHDTVYAVARPLFVLADKPNVHLHLDLDPLLPRAEFDRKQVYSALYNLVSNAISETPSGGSVTIRTRAPQPNQAEGVSNSGGETLLIEVEDTGRGIPEHVRERLFTAKAISTKVGGTGLGTRIVADVVRRHNGTISVQSEVGRGSTFSIRLPLHHRTDEIVDVAASQRLPMRRHNLPSPAARSSLIGREAEYNTVRAWLRSPKSRLVTLTGAGGVGKTRLALQIAHDSVDDFRDGAWLVSLAPVDDAALAVATLAATLGVRQEPGRALAETLTDYLRTRHLLLVLDNFEQIVEAAPVVVSLLRECRELCVLVTSRSALHVPDECELPLSPLQLPDFKNVPQTRALSASEVEAWAQCAAVTLFVERAAQVRSGFTLTVENAYDVAEICARLDGLPLAIELAAAQGATLTPQEIRVRLTNRLQLLEAEVPEREMPALPARHQTLRAAIDWSYELLDMAEQRLLRRLMVFEGGCTPEAAQAVCDGDLGVEVLEGATSLVHRSLLRQQEAEPWFCVLETIREYGLEKLETDGEGEMMRQRHAEYYLRVAESAQEQLLRLSEAAPPLPGVPAADAEPTVWSDWRKREDSNLRVALAWFLDHSGQHAAQEGFEDERSRKLHPGHGALEQGALEHGALRFALTLREIWRGDHWNERREALCRALEQSVDAPVEMRLTGMLRAGDLASLQGDYQQAREFGQQSLELSRRSEVPWGVGRALGILAKVAMEQGDYKAARALHEESLAIHQEVNNGGGVAWTLYHLGTVAQRSRDAVAARDYFERSLVAFRTIGDKEGIAWALYNLGTGIYHRDDPAPARRLLEESLAIFREIANKSGLAWSLSFLGKMAGHARDFARARAFLEESLELARQLSDRAGICATLWNLGDVALAEGDHAAARNLYHEVMSMLQAMSSTTRLRNMLKSFARLAAVEGQMESVARLLGCFDALSQNPVDKNSLNEKPGKSGVPSQDTWQRREAVLARGVLGDVAFAIAWEQGRVMTLQEALDEALRV